MKGLYSLYLCTVGSLPGALPNATKLLLKGEELRQMAGLGSAVTCDPGRQEAGLGGVGR